MATVVETLRGEETWQERRKAGEVWEGDRVVWEHLLHPPPPQEQHPGRARSKHWCTPSVRRLHLSAGMVLRMTSPLGALLRRRGRMCCRAGGSPLGATALLLPLLPALLLWTRFPLPFVLRRRGRSPAVMHPGPAEMSRGRVAVARQGAERMGEGTMQHRPSHPARP